jgi:hypothetical protein
MSNALTGNDTLQINGRIFSDFADADNVSATYPNAQANVKTGKNGNALFAYNASGVQVDMVVRLIRGSGDDKFLLGIQTLQNASFQSFTPMTGQYTKNIGDGQGNVTQDALTVAGGIIEKNVEAKSNVDGDTNQSVAEYHIRWATSSRTLT